MARNELLDLLDRSRGERFEGHRVRAQLWRPAAGPVPASLIVLSHEVGGSARDLGWLIRALLAADLTVAALEHRDAPGIEHLTGLWHRPLDVSFVLDHLSRTAELGPVGAAGFSLGGHTGGALLGARVDPVRFAELLASDPGLATVAPAATRSSGAPTGPVGAERIAIWMNAIGSDRSDQRVQAGYLLEPAFGALLTERSLQRIDLPVAVRWSDTDQNAVPRGSARRYARLIPGADGRSVGSTSGHDYFIDDAADGARMRGRVGADAAAFFQAHLG